ncbi:DEAD/DEAH box helicase [Chromobacterium subtsugae]|uniref:DEAD/DEAH box helicase n=2 Tax=Chromobacterium subtsugae TaxID=251747 RepID=A0ABS7FB99_9NEIS|nr:MULTISPECIES: DEAD/DEAH box helicase [Chromobacterium]MBW7566136.1 DEAD/DEAH box helicase [Chromobacterium subtsugae]MBW8287257.1 DEAD/DEAH box helicase [Chromobacterium subtsugae]WSE90551.1 DEAD/DEAH box helicase [Chromobacterium subtsugae]WVH58924.1 DEAD/DEAH box helicase [Chromobacterium subtsugae]
MSFASLGLQPDLVQSALEQGYIQPTAIQNAAIPAILQGGDVLATAQTGSGKTAAFCLPLLQQWLASPRAVLRQPRSLILLPTRELAAQVGEILRDLAQALPRKLKVAVVYGGVSINPQMMALRGGADIVVATPGRLLDLHQHNALRLSSVKTLVLDEADRLLDQGFAEELNRVLALLPAGRQNLMLSATFPPAVCALAQTLLNQPLRIDIEQNAATTPDIRQRAIEVDADKRTLLLRHLLATHDWDRVLVFVASRQAADRVAGKLARNGVAAAALHGDCSQSQRGQALADLKSGRLRVLVATDVAARGIDIARLPLVVNYDLPRSPADYIHRIGRTGRAGASGEAISFVSADCAAHFKLIEKRQQLRLPRERIDGFEPSEAAAPAASLTDPDGNGGIKGKRKSKKDKLREAAAQQTAADR